MVEPLAVILRNSLFPVRSVLQATSSAVTHAGGKFMHHRNQPFFSPNCFGPTPRQTKGKEKETEEPRPRRVLQCREWSCCTARSFIYCPAHGLPFMLQELLPPRDRSLLRFQNPKAQFSNRFGNRSLRSKGPVGVQRRHTSHATRTARTSTQARSQSGTSHSTGYWNLPSPQEALKRIYELSSFAIPRKDISMPDAWHAFIVIRQSPQLLRDGDHDSVLLNFVERFCDRVELFYEEEYGQMHFKRRREQLRSMVIWLKKRLLSPKFDQFMALEHVSSRCRAMFDQSDAAIEILERIRNTRREQLFDPAIAKTYQSICMSIFHYHDAVHVINFLDRHFFFECFRPPYCYHYRDLGPSALASRHSKLLHILSCISEPMSLFKSSERTTRSNDWPQVVVLLLLAYCHNGHSQLALRVHNAAERQNMKLDGLLKLRLVRALAREGYFDDAFQIYSTIPENTPEYINTSTHLFAYQGDYSRVQNYFARYRNSKHNRAMMMFSLAVQGQVAQVRRVFNTELFPRKGHKYIGAKPTVMEYAIGIYAHARRSRPDGIEYWLGRMKADGFKPNLHIYSSMIQSHLQSGNLTAVAEILDQMRKEGSVPNAVVYTNIITALGRYHNPSTAEGIFKRALRDKVEPDQAMVGALMNSYVEAGHWEEAITLFKSLDENKNTSSIHLNIEMYNITLKAYVIMGAPFRLVATLFEQLDADENVKPNEITFALLLQSACDSGYMHAAMDIFKEMDRRARSGARSLINPYVFTILMSGFLRKGNKDEAMKVYEEMLRRGIQPTSVTFNTVLSYYSNEKSEDSLRLAYEFLTRVATRKEDEPIIAEDNLNMSPVNLVYEPVLRAHAYIGDVEGFERLMDEMLTNGGHLNVTTLSALMDLYRQKNRLESASRVWAYLLEIGEATLRAARFPVEGAEDIHARTDMLCLPLTIYLDTLSRAGEHEYVLQTWQDYQARGLSFNFFNWNRLGVYLICAGEYERAFEVLDRIILPYIRVVTKQARERDLSVALEEDPSESKIAEDESLEKSEEKEEKVEEEKEMGQEKKEDEEREEIWSSPWEVLNKTELAWLQSTILPNRPFVSSTRFKVLQSRNLQQEEEDEEERLRGTPRDILSHLLSYESIPEFIRPLYALSVRPEGTAPRVHVTLLYHLLIGYQRLRAGQPPIPSSDPSQASGEELYHADYSFEQQEKVKAQLQKICDKYPDAIRAVQEFEDSERVRLGEDFEKSYIWA
ncbi:hypothetical protein AN958_08524 [Leucoagaricus sp. SymC.cos]|nr:hypothetical protein AN958_08524 [Leucoagaricus sp. SymC.cos]